jgi:hypothetical protein
MPDTLAISGHGTLVSRAKAATPTVFEAIAELGDVTPPELSRNEFDATVQDKDIDSYVLGVLRRGAMTVPLNFLPTNATHNHLTGLYKAIIDNSVDGYKVTFPDATEWVMSGQVQHIVPKAPVDGKLSADVTFRFSGRMTIGGVVIG